MVIVEAIHEASSCVDPAPEPTGRPLEIIMRFVQIDILPSGKALVDIDKLTHAIPEGEGSRLFLGAQHLDVPHTLGELENVLAGRDRTDNGEHSRAGFGTG
jgi:hypothetical protein